jgi:hypothetical protein
MNSFNVSSTCDRDLTPSGMATGCYYVMKKSVVGKFAFNTESEGQKAFDDMRKFLSARKDSATLGVQLV